MLQTYQSAIVAIISSTVTLVATHFIKSLGNIQVFVNDGLKISLYKYGKSAVSGEEKAKDVNDADHGNIEFFIELLNKSDIPKILRNITIGYYNSDKKLLFSDEPLDQENFQMASYGRIYSHLTTLNISPKTILRFKLKTFFKAKEFKDCKSVYFEYNDFKGKHKKELIYTKKD